MGQIYFNLRYEPDNGISGDAPLTQSILKRAETMFRTVFSRLSRKNNVYYCILCRLAIQY